MNKTITLLVVVCLSICCLGLNQGPQSVVAQQEKQEAGKANKDDADSTDLAAFMRKKLHSSNQILEGLVTDNLAMVKRGGEELLKMSKAEGWRASNDMMYLQHSREFRSSVDVLMRKAEKKSIDGTALAWVDVTLNCIQCHEWVRDAMLVDNSGSFISTQHQSALAK